MNLELLQPSGQSYPDQMEISLECGSEAVTCSFNRRGTLLAVGCNDGSIEVFDFLTRMVAKSYLGHVHPVTSLSWSRAGYKLLSTSTDNNVCVWDVLSGECEQRYHFSSPILRAQFHPRNKEVLLVSPIWNPPVLIKIQEQHQHTSLPTDGESVQNIVASFTHKGEYIFTGSAKGRILIIEFATLQVIRSFKVSSGHTAVKSFEFSRRGNSFLINCADRVIRIYSQNYVMECPKNEEPEPSQKLQDLVNRTLWKKCAFSGDGEYVAAGSYQEHALYIWDKSNGSLVKILSGQKGENMLDIVWHPVRPIIVSISNGTIYVWNQNLVENWSAFAPDFKELEENAEYEERESEFDIEDEDKSVKSDDRSGDSQAESVDVCSIHAIPAYCSSDEDWSKDEGGLYWLPTAPDIDDPEDGPGWGQLEPSLSNLENLENISKRPLESPTLADIPNKKTRTIDIPLANNYEQKPQNDKRSRKAGQSGQSLNKINNSNNKNASKKGKNKSNAKKKSGESYKNRATPSSKISTNNITTPNINTSNSIVNNTISLISTSSHVVLPPSSHKETLLHTSSVPPYTSANIVKLSKVIETGQIEVLDSGSILKDLETSSSSSDESSDQIQLSSQVKFNKKSKKNINGINTASESSET